MLIHTTTAVVDLPTEFASSDLTSNNSYLEEKGATRAINLGIGVGNRSGRNVPPTASTAT